MKQILKTIVFGILLGTAVFFVPFIFKFILGGMVIAMIFKMFTRNRRKYYEHSFSDLETHFSPIFPIDNQWYVATIQSNKPVQNINISY